MKSIILSLSICFSLTTVNARADEESYEYREPDGAFSCGISHSGNMEYLSEQFTCKGPMSVEQMDKVCREILPKVKNIKAIGIVGNCD